MTLAEGLAGLLALAVFVYLLWALVRAERF
jgi:K+-transporting ATPase KdpF subunit